MDTGGTFTDLIFQDAGKWRVHKLPSTSRNPAEAVLAGLEAIDPGGRRHIVHGSTVATNALLERKGVKTALVTNERFTDLIVIGRQNRTRIYDLTYRRPPCLVPDDLRFGLPGRILADGTEHEPFDDAAARRITREIGAMGVESVAVCLLFSFVNSDHEDKMGRVLSALGLPVSLSHDILPEFREFERTAATVINAYVSPRMARYISHLLDNLNPGETLRVMQSNGGGISADAAMAEPVRTILSGPAGGVAGACAVGAAAGFPKLITFDMGGTSTDVSLIDGEPALTTESVISGYPLKVPMIDIHTVGAGGGSMARADAGGSLKVGPESAGADPGPICYGRGERITVTDANLFLGRLIPDHFLGGTMPLHPDRLGPRFEKGARELGLDPVEFAEGVLTVANASMARAIRVISVERGADPRAYTLFSFGGAGGLHAADLARQLHIPRVLIPRNPGILSAMGMLMADVIKDYSQTVMIQADDIDADGLQALFRPMAERGKADLAAEGVGADQMVMERFLDMRYEGQSYEIMTPFQADFRQAFHRRHETLYGYRKSGPAQIVTIRLRARGVPEKPAFERPEPGGTTPEDKAFLGERDVIIDGRRTKAAVFNRDGLRPGNRIEGPAVVVEYSATLFLPGFTSTETDEFGNLLIHIRTPETDGA